MCPGTYTTYLLFNQPRSRTIAQITRGLLTNCSIQRLFTYAGNWVRQATPRQERTDTRTRNVTAVLFRGVSTQPGLMRGTWAIEGTWGDFHISPWPIVLSYLPYLCHLDFVFCPALSVAQDLQPYYTNLSLRLKALILRSTPLLNSLTANLINANTFIIIKVKAFFYILSS